MVLPPGRPGEPLEAVEAVVAPDVPVTVVGRRGLRGGLRRLSQGLIWYGALGLALAVLGLVGLVYVGDRLGSLGDRIGSQVDSIALTLEDTSAALSDASSTATSFGTTLDRTPATLDQVATTVASLRTDLITVQTDLGAITILGARPLASVADLFGRMAGNLDGLEGRLAAIGTDLQTNRGRLAENAESLELLGDRLTILAAELRGDLVMDSLDDVRVVLSILMVLFILWAGLPAAGALFLGLWLRRELRPRAGPSAQVAPEG
jgi:hypothetical protein